MILKKKEWLLIMSVIDKEIWHLERSINEIEGFNQTLYLYQQRKAELSVIREKMKIMQVD